MENQSHISTEENAGTIQQSGIKFPYVFPGQKFGPMVGGGGVPVCCGTTLTKQKAQLMTAPTTRFAFRLTRNAVTGDMTLTQANVAAVQLLVNGVGDTGAQNGLWWTLADADTQNIAGGAFDARDCVFLVLGMSFAFEFLAHRGNPAEVPGQVADAIYLYQGDMDGAGSYAERTLRAIAHGVASIIYSQGSNSCTLDGGNVAQSYSGNVVIKDGEFVGTQMQLGPYNPFVYPWIAGAKDDGDQMGVQFSSSRDYVIANDPGNPTFQDLYAFFRAYFFGIRVPRAALVQAGITCTNNGVGGSIDTARLAKIENVVGTLASTMNMLTAAMSGQKQLNG